MLARPRRSVLYMPGSNAKALAKAATLPADAVILDLEDSVAPDAKEMAARAQVVAAVKGDFGGREVIIRVNGPHTPWGPDDLVVAAAAGPDAILLPKVDGPGAIMHAARVMRENGAPDRTRLWAMMETPNAVLNAGQIAAVAADSASRLEVMVMGLNDLAKETRARLTPGRPTMTAWLAIARSRRAPTASTSSTASTTTSGTSRVSGPNACKAATWASTARRLSIRARSTSATKCFAPSADGGRRAPARSSRPSPCRKTPARASSSSTARWSSCCTPRWRGAPSPSPTRIAGAEQGGLREGMTGETI